MRTCQVCGFNNTDRDEKCLRCSAILRGVPAYAEEDFIAERRRRGVHAKPGVDFRSIIPIGRIRNRLRRLAQSIEWFDIPQDVPERNPWLAAALGIIPGVAQLYNFQPKKAAFFVGVSLLFLAAAAATWYLTASNVILVGLLLWTIFSYHDGLRTALQINRQTWTLRNSFAAFFAWIFYVGAISLIVQDVLSAELIKFRYIHENFFEPVIHDGDHVAINVAGYTFGHPRVGDVVYYDPKMIKIGQGDSAFLVDAISSIERVVAEPGHTFEKRGGKFYRDGVEVSPEEGPMVNDEVWWDYKITAPEGHYVIIHSHNGRETLNIGYSGPTPRMTPPTADNDWFGACVIPEKVIMGRVWFVYQPPKDRRWIAR